VIDGMAIVSCADSCETKHDHPVRGPMIGGYLTIAGKKAAISKVELRSKYIELFYLEITCGLYLTCR
jgi:hypothetical protein